MSRARALVLSAFAAAVLVLGACGSDGEESSPATTTAGERSAGGDDAGCTVDGVDDAELEDIIGVEFDPPEPTKSTVVSTAEYTLKGCVWQTSDIGVSVTVAGPDDFADGYACPEPVGGVNDPVREDDLGDEAWWVPDDEGGSLEICTGEERVVIRFLENPLGDTDVDEAKARADAMELAEAMQL